MWVLRIVMTYPSMQPIPPAAADHLAGRDADQEDESNRELVGASDAAADAARSGSNNVDLTGADRDSDGVPVGEDDLQADIDRSTKE
jgi:hypothetical protein